MDTHVSVPIPTRQFLELIDFLKKEGSDRDPVEAVRFAVEYWIDNANWKKEELLPEVVDKHSRGYTWKDIFLPDGTGIRMKYKKRGAALAEYYYAKVVNDDIIYNNNRFTPSQLANTITQSSRNAWRDLWVKRPNDKEWIPVLSLRPKNQSEAERLLNELDQLPRKE